MLGYTPAVEVKPQVLQVPNPLLWHRRGVRVAWVDTGSPPPLGEIEVVVGKHYPCPGKSGYFATC
jgi:hypothetical protein